MKKVIVVLISAGFVIISLGFVVAQNVQSNVTQTQSETQTAPPKQFSRGFDHDFGPGFGGDNLGGGFGGLPFGHHLALGTTVTLSFYATNPANSESTPEQTLNFTYGEDSEAAFAQSFAEARANAGYVRVNVGEQTQTLELPADTSAGPSNFDGGFRRGGVYGIYGVLPLRGLGEGSSVTATFFDGDPAGDAQTLQTLNFTYGQDSEAGFATEFASAAENAAFVTLTTSPQTTTVNLSNIASRFGDFGRGDGGRGGMDNDFYRGGPGGRR